MKKLSIIIPVYNTASYIEKCLNSCLKQDVRSVYYEVILIDDGSTDNSVEIIKSLQEFHSNIVLIQKENGGVSSARNKGILAAKGEYLMFVDSDDAIKENSLGAITTELDKRKVQLIILNSHVYEDDVIIRSKYQFPKELSKRMFSGIELFQNQYSRGSVCGVAFNREFILNNNLLFSREMRNGEDSLFMSMAFLYADSVSYLDIDFYKVTIRDGSASRSWDYKRVDQMLNGLDEIDVFIKTHSLNNGQLAILNIRAYSIISNALFHFFSINKLNRYFDLRRKIKNSPLYPIKSYGAKQFKKKIYLLNFSFDLFCLPFILRRLYIDTKKTYQDNLKL